MDKNNTKYISDRQEDINYIALPSDKLNLKEHPNLIPTLEMIDNLTKPLEGAIKELMTRFNPIIDSIIELQFNYTPFFKGIAEAVEEAQKDPDNLYNWLGYTEKLCDYFWTVPYDMSARKLKNIFERVNSESEFDAYMRNYYKKEIVQKMIDEINFFLPKKHQLVFSQIEFAYNKRKYALSIIGMMSIIDELCIFFIDDKGTSSRINMFKPIIDDIEKNEGIDYNLIDAMILSNNINAIYENIDFNKKINIKTKKKARRNPCQHGRSYSNRKTDAIMLLNTIYNLLIFQVSCAKYENVLKYSNKKFEFKNTK